MFKHIALISNRNSKKIATTLDILVNHLRSNSVKFVLDSGCARILQDSDLAVWYV